jgi:hypothetical protein
MARASKRLVMCLDHSGYEVSLERRKIYLALPDAEGAPHGRIRVLDEVGRRLPVSRGTLHRKRTSVGDLPGSDAGGKERFNVVGLRI